MLLENGYRANRIIKIPILVELSTQITDVDRFSDPFLFHAGTLNENKDGIVSVFKAFALILKKHPKLKFILTNRTTIPNTLKKISRIISDNQMEKSVIFLDHITNEQVQEYMRKCSFAIINKPSNTQNRYNFSTKLGEYLINEVPTITTATGEVRNYIIDNNNAFLIEPDDLEAMVSKMDLIISNPELSKQVALKGRELALRNFQINNYSSQFKEFLNTI